MGTAGLTRASGLTKLMMSEAKNFPDIAAFYQQEVVMPGQALIRSILQRGMDRGEFRPMDLDYAVYLGDRAHDFPDPVPALRRRVR